VLFEMLTLARAFPNGPMPEPVARACQLDKDLPRAVDDVLARALAYASEDRYGSAEELRDALKAALAPVTVAHETEVAAWVRELEALPSSSEAGLLSTDKQDPNKPTVAGRNRVTNTTLDAPGSSGSSS
jgi:hypothetical protein